MGIKSPKVIRVLICDDDPGDCKLVSNVLQEISKAKTPGKEFLVYEARTQTDISSIIKEFQFDLIFLDLVMPGKSGLQWLPDLVDIAAVIMLSDYFDEKSPVLTGYIPKTWFSAKENMVLVNRAIDTALSARAKEKALDEAKKKLCTNTADLTQNAGKKGGKKV